MRVQIDIHFFNDLTQLSSIRIRIKSKVNHRTQSSSNTVVTQLEMLTHGRREKYRWVKGIITPTLTGKDSVSGDKFDDFPGECSV